MPSAVLSNLVYSTGVSVLGVIDKGKHLFAEGVPMLKLNDELPNADAIVVTAVYYMDEICEEIRAVKGDVPIISLMELLLFAEESENKLSGE